MQKITSASFTFALTGRIENKFLLPGAMSRAMKRLPLRGANFSKKLLKLFFKHYSNKGASNKDLKTDKKFPNIQGI